MGQKWAPKKESQGRIPRGLHSLMSFAKDGGGCIRRVIVQSLAYDAVNVAGSTTLRRLTLRKVNRSFSWKPIQLETDRALKVHRNKKSRLYLAANSASHIQETLPRTVESRLGRAIIIWATLYSLVMSGNLLVGCSQEA